MRPAVFLDRDGTINVRPAEHEYIRDVRDFSWLPGALEGMVRLAREGLPLIIVSNQRGVGRGLVTIETIRRIEVLIQDAMSARGCRIEAFCYCFHDLDARCECRKPKPGLLRDAAAEMQLDLARSWMVGDSDDDVQAGLAAGCTTIQLTTAPSSAQFTAVSLFEAAAIVLAERKLAKNA